MLIDLTGILFTLPVFTESLLLFGGNDMRAWLAKLQTHQGVHAWEPA